MSAVNRVRAAYARIEAVDRPEIWIDLRPRAEVEAEIRARLTSSEPVPEHFGRRRIGFDRSSARSAEEAVQDQ
jgi:hypothetical protein